MSLDRYKKIENKRGYFIDDVDSEIFERGLRNSLYGSGENDVIRFTLYDVNENLLSQHGYGNIRYITSKDFEKYFRKIKDTDRGSNEPFKYELNVDKLIKEAGYNTGIFKVEVLLVNDRVGTNNKPVRLWIHEISPSRTEIRVLPLKVKNSNLQNRLDERYEAFLQNKMFLDDIIEILPTYLDSIGADAIEQILLTDYSNEFLKQLKEQYFKNTSIDTMYKNILEDYSKVMNNVVKNKNSNLGTSSFGTPLNIKLPITLNIKQIAIQKLKDVINHHLPNMPTRTSDEIKYKKSVFPVETQNLINKIK